MKRGSQIIFKYLTLFNFNISVSVKLKLCLCVKETKQCAEKAPCQDVTKNNKFESKSWHKLLPPFASSKQMLVNANLFINKAKTQALAPAIIIRAVRKLINYKDM